MSIIINMNIRMIMRMIIGLIMNIIINMRRITRMIMRIGVTIWIIKLVKIVVLVNDNDNRDRLCPRSQNRAMGGELMIITMIMITMIIVIIYYKS